MRPLRCNRHQLFIAGCFHEKVSVLSFILLCFAALWCYSLSWNFRPHRPLFRRRGLASFCFTRSAPRIFIQNERELGVFIKIWQSATRINKISSQTQCSVAKERQRGSERCILVLVPPPRCKMRQLIKMAFV